jgi:hypothetical protein
MPKRANFINIQMSHIVPQVNGETGRVRTGYEAVIPYMAGNTFSIKSKQAGIVTSIDDKKGIMLVKYQDGTTEAMKIGTIIGEVSGSFINHNLVLASGVQIGYTFKANEILAYNEGFFQQNKYTKQTTFKHGVYANIALLESDVTIEDASMISSDFANRMGFVTSAVRTVKLDTSMTIQAYANVGDHINFTDSLMRISYADVESLDLKGDNNDSDDVELLLDDLQTVKAKANISGTISQINIYYSTDKENFHPSIIKFINQQEKIAKDTMNYIKGVKNEYDYNMPTKVEPGTRIRKKALEDNTLLVEYVISKDTKYGIADKMVIGTCLKTVVSKINDTPAQTVDGSVKIDAEFGSKSLFNRIVLGDVKIGITERIIDGFEDILRKKYRR